VHPEHYVSVIDGEKALNNIALAYEARRLLPPTLLGVIMDK